MVNERATVMARLKYLEEWCFDINGAYIIGPNLIQNSSIDISPFLETPSNHFDIQLEAASMSIVKMCFNDDDGRYANLHLASNEFVFVMPGGNGHERHIQRSIEALRSLSTTERNITIQHIHDFMKGALLDGSWTDIEAPSGVHIYRYTTIPATTIKDLNKNIRYFAKIK